MRYIRHFEKTDKTIVTITSDGGANISIQSSATPDDASTIDLEQYHALWLVNDTLEFKAEETEAYQEWFTERYRFCARYYEDEGRTIDLYVRADILCAAVDESSAIDVRYDSGLRLHNASSEVSAETIRFFLAWTQRYGGDIRILASVL